MKQKDLFSYVYDFISQIMENEHIFKNVRSILLFGSVARGDFDKESDVDLFIDISDVKQEVTMLALIKKEVSIFETRCEKTWYLKGIHLPLKPIAGDLQASRWDELRKETEHYGVFLFRRLEDTSSLLKRQALVLFDINHLKQKKKMALIRALYGYSSIKGVKKYKNKGILSELGGEKIEHNAVVIPFEHLKVLRSTFRKHKTRFTIKKYWSR